MPTHRDDFAPNGHRFADDLEGQNDERLEGLTAKVKLLKDVSAAAVSRFRRCLNSFVRYPLGLGTR